MATRVTARGVIALLAVAACDGRQSGPAGSAASEQNAARSPGQTQPAGSKTASPQPAPPQPGRPQTNPPAPSLANKIAAFDARLASTICNTMCRCNRVSGCVSTCASGILDASRGDDQVLVARGCRLDESEIDDCLATANADCGVLDDFGEWKLDVERRCANVVPCTKP